jgi:hypothetical protein
MIYRGTTPPLTFEVPFEPALAKKIWITFSQDDKEIFTITQDSLSYNGKIINATLTQEQTLKFSADLYVQIQIRVSFAGEKFDEAQASEVITAEVKDILKDGVI